MTSIWISHVSSIPSKFKKCCFCRPETKSSVLPLGIAYIKLSWLPEFTTPGLAGRGLRCVNRHEWKAAVEATTVWRTGGEGRGRAEVIRVNSPRLYRVQAVWMSGKGWPRLGSETGTPPHAPCCTVLRPHFLTLSMHTLVARPRYT